jgi:hypothetical protein
MQSVWNGPPLDQAREAPRFRAVRPEAQARLSELTRRRKHFRGQLAQRLDYSARRNRVQQLKQEAAVSGGVAAAIFPRAISPS